MLGRGVKSLTVGNVDGMPSATGVLLTNGHIVNADYYVSALPPQAMLNLLPQHWKDHSWFAPAGSHTWAPIVNLHIWYDRTVGDFDFVAFVNSPVQWAFNRTRIANLKSPGDYLTISLSGAWKYWPKSKSQLRELFLPEIERLFPLAQDAEVVRFLVVKEQRATFQSLPGKTGNRLGTHTPIANFLLAGDWTDTRWPATMESAVRSGNAAAALIQGNDH